jgi:hypothetical protein
MALLQLMMIEPNRPAAPFVPENLSAAGDECAERNDDGHCYDQTDIDR